MVTQIENLLERIAVANEAIAEMQIANPQNWNDVRAIVRAGKGAKHFPVGTQITVKWKDTAANTEYDVPLDVVHHGKATLEDGTEVPAMYLQWHYATPFGIQFSNNVPMRYADVEIPAGTYHFTIGSNWGNNLVNGKVYQFTLSKAVPIGGVITGIQQAPDIAPSNWRIKTYANPTHQNALEEVALTEGVGGTDLGVFATNDKNDTENACQDLYRIAYGYNNWKKSAIRQWLNSDKEKGLWWKPKSNLEYRPNELYTKDGFMRGFEEEFLNVIATVKVSTMTNTVNDGGVEDVTYDKFFLPSLEQEHCQKQANGEGETWEYWKRTLDSETPQPQYSTWPNHIRYGVENHNSALTVRLRSAYRGNTFNTWSVSSSGYLNHNSAWTSYRVAPACVIA